METLIGGFASRCTALVLVTIGLAACGAARPPIERVPQVDLDRFMGDWYVIAHIPTFIEDEAEDAIERYDRNADGSIATTFSFHEGDPVGEREVYHATGFVRPGTGNAVWDMQFVWPFRSEYIVGRLDADYRHVVIVRSARDYAWVMARSPSLPEAELGALTAWLGAQGYDLSGLRRVPHRSEAGQGAGAAPP
jgi:apolipoprotein D and lipocalin family protein